MRKLAHRLTRSEIGIRGRWRLRFVAVAVCAASSLSGACAQESVRIRSYNGQAEIKADLYGHGSRAVILAHGGRFDEKSWKDQAQVLARSGYLVLALRFRGDGPNPDGSPGSFGSTPENADDVLAGISYLRSRKVKEISAIGASFGGDAVGEADARSERGSLARIVLLASAGGDHPEKLSGRKLFIVAREDSSGSGPRLPEIQDHFARAPEPKKLVILDGSAHAQFLFGTDQGPRLLHEILSFLSAP